MLVTVHYSLEFVILFLVKIWHISV